MKLKIATAVLSITAFGLSLTPIAHAGGGSDTPPRQQPGSGGIEIAKTPLKCTAGSGLQDVSKTLSVLNTSKKTIPANTNVHFATSDGEKDYQRFDHAIAPNTVFIIATSHPKDGTYTCSAWISGLLK
ncbi:MAG: hypothetical protein JF606_25575 [Burkholderiales bacterium]|jgi:hypothetical protein|nr:hypothetical protein [Burkholderiales bacterium]